MIRNKSKILAELLTLPISSLEKLAVFAKSKTKRVLANRLLRLHYKKFRVFKVTYSVSDSCTFPQEDPYRNMKAYSPEHCAYLLKKSDIDPNYRRFFQINESYAEFLSLEYTTGSEDFNTTEAFLIEDLENVKQREKEIQTEHEERRKIAIDALREILETQQTEIEQFNRENFSLPEKLRIPEEKTRPIVALIQW